MLQKIISSYDTHKTISNGDPTKTLGLIVGLVYLKIKYILKMNTHLVLRYDILIRYLS